MSVVVHRLSEKVWSVEEDLMKWKIWQYPGAVERATVLEAQKQALMREYRNLRSLYEEKTGEKAPRSPFLETQKACKAWEELRRMVDSFGGR